MHIYQLNLPALSFVFTKMKIVRKTFFLLGLIITGFSSLAQEPQNLLGLPYTSAELTELRSTFKSDSALESFLPYLKVYQLDYPQDGIKKGYNSDVALYQISLFDSGYRYNAYAGDLPFDVQWGMTLEEVQKKTNLLDIDDQNIYVRKYRTDDYVIDFYFMDGGLHHIKLTASLKLLQDNITAVRQATGIRLLPDGKVREGNVLDGVGTMSWGNGTAVYQGEWSYGLPHGEGQYLDSFGNKYEGEFKLGFLWGQGKFFSKPYQYSYTGEYAMGKKHGKGKIVYANKTSYDGEWMQDAMHGMGKYFVGRNYMYQGEMKENAFNGEGTLETPQGRIKGTFKNGKPHGVCKQETLDGTQSVMGNFSNGKKNGIFTINLNGEKREVLYENDIEISNEKVDPQKVKSSQ